MARWLLVAEGPSELGTAEAPDRFAFLDTVLDQLAEGGRSELGDTQRRGAWPCDEADRISCRALATQYRLDPPQPKGMAKVAARAAKAAKALGCDAVVLLVDRDHKPEREHDLAEGLADCPYPHAGGVATEMLEAWLLADPELLGRSRVHVTKRPEELWGKPDDPTGQHPKAVFQKVLGVLGIDRHKALERWRVAPAAANAPHLAEFCRQLTVLLRDSGLRPEARDPG